MTTLTKGHFVVGHRDVLTYEPHGWPAAVITGYADGKGGWVIEHVIVFESGALRGLVAVGLEEAWTRGYDYVTFTMPRAFPLRTKLMRLATRFGFRRYQATERFDFFVRHRGP